VTTEHQPAREFGVKSSEMPRKPAKQGSKGTKGTVRYPVVTVDGYENAFWILAGE